MKAFIRRCFFVASACVFAVFVLPVLYMMEPFKRIRIGVLYNDRIGHLGPNTEIYCRRRQLGLVDTSALTVFLSWNPANRQLQSMYARVLNVVESRWLRRASIGFLPILRRTRFHQDLPCTFREHRELAEGKSTLSFTSEEVARGRQELAAFGISDKDWFICFHARDSAYLARRTGFPLGTHTSDFRDCRIETYLDAVHWITAQGGYAIRMGAIVDAPLQTGNPQIIDYATTARSDFMDIYLAAHCRFWLGNGSGLNYIPLLFDVPTAIANFCPYTQVGFGPRMMFIPKLLRRKSDGYILSFPEIRDLGLLDPPSEKRDLCYDQEYYWNYLGLEWLDSSSADILDLAMDRLDAIEGRQPSPDAQRLQEAYKRLYVAENACPESGPIGPRFALKYRHLIMPVRNHVRASQFA